MAKEVRTVELGPPLEISTADTKAQAQIVVTLADFIFIQRRRFANSQRKAPKRAMRGACMCGNISYEFDSKSFKTLLCHCQNCQKITGSAYSSNITVPSCMVTVRGQPRKFEFDSEKSVKFRISFCANCSSTLWKESDADGLKGFHIIQAGTLGEDFRRYRREGEIFVDSRLPWFKAIDGVEQFERSDI